MKVNVSRRYARHLHIKGGATGSRKPATSVPLPEVFELESICSLGNDSTSTSRLAENAELKLKGPIQAEVTSFLSSSCTHHLDRTSRRDDSQSSHAGNAIADLNLYRPATTGTSYILRSPDTDQSSSSALRSHFGARYSSRRTE